MRIVAMSSCLYMIMKTISRESEYQQTADLWKYLGKFMTLFILSL